MKKIQALKNTLCHKSIIYAALCLAVIGFQPASSYADGHGIESEWTVGFELRFGELKVDLERTGFMTVMGRATPERSFPRASLEEVGGGGGAFLRYDAHLPNDWIVGTQLTAGYDQYSIVRRAAGGSLSRSNVNTTHVDILGRVSYDTRREIRPFIALGPTFLISKDIRVEDDYLFGIKVGVGVDLVLDAFDGHMVVSIGYLHSNYFDQDLARSYPAPNFTITGGKNSSETHHGTISVGYRF